MDNLLDALKFVQGAVSRKDYVPELEHFRIKMGRITGYNGRIALSAPIPLDIDCCPKAIPFVKAIQACEETAQLHLTLAGKLAIRSGAFRTHVETISDAFGVIEPEGQTLKPSGPILPVLRMLYEITSDDASRPWANGILFDGESAYATNNVVLVERWLGYHFPFRINVPRFAIKELLRISEEPTQLFVCASSITFVFEGDKWLRSQLLSTEWPDIGALFGVMPPTRTRVPEGFFEALEKLHKFVGDDMRVYLQQDAIATAPGDEGTTIELKGVMPGGIFNCDMLQLLEGVAQVIGFEEYPRPVPFYGDQVRGLIAGMRT